MATKKAVRKTARGRAQDRAKVAGGQRYEVSYEAKKTGRSAPAVKKAVKKFGNVRKKVEKKLARWSNSEARRSLRRALGASVADGIQNLPELSYGGVRREVGWWVLPGDFDGMIASVRIRPILGPAVILAFVNGVRVLQYGHRPAS
jgi:hypothetical protein